MEKREKEILSRTGVVSENMQGLGAKLRKLAGQAKICTPPGGEVIAKICNSHMCSDLDTLRPLATGSPHFFLSPPSGGGYVSQRDGNFVAAAVQFRSGVFTDTVAVTNGIET